MGFLEDAGYRKSYRLTHKDAAWIHGKISVAGAAGKAFWDALSPCDRLDILDSYFMQLSTKDPLRIRYETDQRDDLISECDSHLRKIR